MELQILPKWSTDDAGLYVSCQEFGTSPRDVDLAVLGMNATDLFGSCIPGLSICISLSELHTVQE